MAGGTSGDKSVLQSVELYSVMYDVWKAGKPLPNGLGSGNT